MVLREQYRNVKICEACQVLGQASQGLGDTLILVTLSPNPELFDYADLLPRDQLIFIHGIMGSKSIRGSLTKHFDGSLKILSEHYEFNKSGNLHSHCLFSIAPVMCTPANLQTISKIFHRKIGRQYARSSICCDVRIVHDDDIYKYLNKENIYPPQHYQQLTLYHYVQQEEPEEE